MPERRPPISIWFFIGLLLAAYGALILAAGLWQIPHPSQPPVALAALHLEIYWGGLLLAAGLFYSLTFRPRG